MCFTESCDDLVESKKCKNGGTCNEENSVKICSCKPGTSGDFCGTIEKCKEVECGNDATCILDESENVMCKCNNPELAFDKTDNKCKGKTQTN